MNIYQPALYEIDHTEPVDFSDYKYGQQLRGNYK